MRAFLDANVLFSGALGGAAFDLLWELAARARIELLTSPYCYLEARTNLERKAPAALPRLDERMVQVRVTGHGTEHLAWALTLVAEKDAAVLAAARAAGAELLVTGDLRHFDHLMRRDDLPVAVVTVRTLLLDRAPDTPYLRRPDPLRLRRRGQGAGGATSGR